MVEATRSDVGGLLFRKCVYLSDCAGSESVWMDDVRISKMQWAIVDQIGRPSESKKDDVAMCC